MKPKAAINRKYLLLITVILCILLALLLWYTQFREQNLPEGVRKIDASCQDMGVEGGTVCLPPYYYFNNEVDQKVIGLDEKAEICKDLGGKWELTYVGGVAGSNYLCLVD